MPLSIRTEQSSDYPDVFAVIRAAFAAEEHSDQSEPFLVERLRASSDFVSELSMVAEWEGELVGHILLTPVEIVGQMTSTKVWALAPVSVRPSHQGRGIGSALIKAAHEKASSMDYPGIVLIGHENFYPRFGYVPADTFGITFPFEAPAANCMVKELIPGGLRHVQGVVQYPEAFGLKI